MASTGAGVKSNTGSTPTPAMVALAHTMSGRKTRQATTVHRRPCVLGCRMREASWHGCGGNCADTGADGAASSVAQLTFGLLISFFSFGAYMLFSPYAKDSDDWLSQLCQAQTFFALLSSVILETLPPDRSEARNMGALLVLLMALPVVVATWIELSDKEDKKRAKERMLLKTLKRFVLTPVWKKLMLKRAELGRKQREKEKGR